MGEIKTVCIKCGKEVDPKLTPQCPHCTDKTISKITGNIVIIGLALDDDSMCDDNGGDCD